MSIKEIFLILSIIIGLITPIIGIRAILIGEYKPHRITRLLFLIENTFFVTSLLFVGDRVGLFLALIQFLSSVAIFILALKYGLGGTERIDLIIFTGAIITLIVWKTTNDPVLALYMSILTDLLAFIPTFIKVWKNPFTEDPKFYLSDTIASFFNLLALTSFLLKDVAYPFYIFAINLFSLLLIVFRRPYTKNLPKSNK